MGQCMGHKLAFNGQTSKTIWVDDGTPGLLIGHTDVSYRSEEYTEYENTRQNPSVLPDINDPRLVLKTVRVFLSSTFTDTKVDRNALMEEVFDPIRDLCQEHGISFEVVDLRWGVRQESVDDHRVVNICMEEIKRCQDTSLGVAFVAILGDKYGWRPLPPSIQSQELEALLSHVGQSERELFSTWYVRDDNAILSCYQLQPISIQFPVHSLDKDDLSKAWEGWRELEKRLLQSLNTAAEKAGLNDEEKRKYDMSITHMEVEKGVLTDPNSNQRSIVVDRRFTEVNGEDAAASDYINMEKGKPDEHCVNLMTELKENRIPASLDVDSVLKFCNLQWHREGLSFSQHDSYIREMCTKVRELLTSRIYQIIESIGEPNPLKEEITRHAIFCRDHTHSFEGRASILRVIHDYVDGPDPMMPFVLHGESGVGKTTLIAKATLEIQLKHGNLAVMYRFCGTTPSSSTGRELTESLCNQIKQVYDIADEVPENYASLCEIFPEFMAHASKEQPLCIIIDSLDQLTDENAARRFLEWLPRLIPAHVRVIVSTLPEDGGCLARLKTFGLPGNHFAEVCRLDRSDGPLILDAWLRSANRTLTPEQRNIVLEAFNNCPLPLYLQLLFRECCSWTSYRPISSILLKPGVIGMINSLYEKLERYHGKSLVGRVLGLLAARPDGMNRDDILHVLSCDDELLADVLTWHQPPKRRLPPLLLARLKYDLGPFLVERGGHGVSLFAFYHRQFVEVARERYLRGDNYKAKHSTIAKYFSGQYHKQYGKDRGIPPQPNAYSSQSLNLRKLTILPASLIEAREFNNLRDCLGDLEFIQAKCMAGMGYDLMAQCTSAVHYASEGNTQEDVHQDLSDILGFLRSEVHILTKNPILTFQQAAEYPETSWIGRAARRMREKLSQSGGSVLPQPDGWVEWINKPNVQQAFEFELSGHSKGVLSTCFSIDDRNILSASEDSTIRVWDSQTGTLLAQLDGHTGAVTCVRPSPDGELIASGSVDKTIRVWNSSNEFLLSLEGHQDRVTSVAFSRCSNKVLSVSLDKTIRIWDVHSGECLDTIAGHSGHPMSCAWSPADDSIAATCGDNLEVFIWDLTNQSIRFKLEGHKVDETMINFPDKEKLSGHEQVQYDSLIWSVNFSKDGKLLATTGTDSSVIVWNVDTGERRCTFNIPNDGSAVCFMQTEHGTRLAAASAPHMTVTLFDVGAEPRTIALLGGHSGWVMDIAFNSDGSMLASASRDKTIRVWDTTVAEKLREVLFHSERCWSVAYSDDGKWLASASDDFKVCVWDMSIFKHVLVYEGHEKKRTFSCGVRACTFSHDTRYVASGGDEMKIRVWSRETGEDKIVLPCESSLLPWCLRFSPDDMRLIAVGEFAKGVQIWDLETQTKIADLGGHQLFCQYTEYSPSGKLIISSSIDNTAQIWNSNTFEHVVTLQHAKWATCAAFSHDEKLIATCSTDLKVRLWSTLDYQEIAALEGHESEIRMVSFSPDDKVLASAALDQTIRVWDVIGHAQIHVFYAASGLWGLAWHPREWDLLTAGDALGYLYFLKLNKREDIEIVKKVIEHGV